MGWYAFPDEPAETKARAEMLDETIDILTLLFGGRPFDYDGKHFHIQLTKLPEQYYPPQPVQQPRIPLWVPAQYPRRRPLARALKADGVIVEKLGVAGAPEPPEPDDVRAVRATVAAERELTTPFDIVVVGETRAMGAAERQDALAAWADAGVTWWVEDLFGGTVAEVAAFLEAAPTAR
jgi:alkanesulfonate monooxygenase SsuD/methylene tetrahydromethanopterin reductase-like flavin-dependent oxidoreductase (luciferase family)